MQTCLGGYATNIYNIQSLSGWDIQQTQIYSMDMMQKVCLMRLHGILLTISLIGFSFATVYRKNFYFSYYFIHITILDLARGLQSAYIFAYIPIQYEMPSP